MVAMGAISSIYVGHSCPSNGCCVPPASLRASEACAASSLSDNRKSVVCGAHLHSLCVCVLFVLQFRDSIFCLFITLYGTVSRVGKRSFFSPPFFLFFWFFSAILSNGDFVYLLRGG